MHENFKPNLAPAREKRDAKKKMLDRRIRTGVAALSLLGASLGAEADERKQSEPRFTVEDVAGYEDVTDWSDRDFLRGFFSGKQEPRARDRRISRRGSERSGKTSRRELEEHPRGFGRI